MKNIKCILCIVICIALVLFAFCGCTFNIDVAIENGEKSNAEAAAVPITATTAASTEVQIVAPTSATTQKEASVSDNSDSKVDAQKPTSREELVSAYNNCVAASGLNCSSVQQKIVSGTVGTKDNVVIDFSDPKYTEDEGEIAFRETFERNDINGIALTSLSPDDIENVSVSGNTVTFNLKDFSASESVTGEMHGYLNIVDTARSEEIGMSVKNAVPNAPGKVKLKSTAVSMSNGVLAAEFNDDFTQLKSVNFSSEESVNAAFSYLLLTITADLKYNITSEYKP